MANAVLRLVILSAGLVSVGVGVACSGDGSDDPARPSAVGAPLPAPTPAPTGTTPAPTPDPTPAVVTTPTGITFHYKPSWKGVTTVEVLGGFGLPSDWTAPFAILTAQSDGTFTGTAPALADGLYPYIFRVTGDEAASPTSLVRYVLDGTSSGYVACPPTSPSYSKAAPNPCSELAVPSAPSATAHVRGTVVSKGKPIAGYLVMIEREETGSHHYFVDRATTGDDGTYDLPVALGTYRVSVLHPTYLSKNDAQRPNPTSYDAIRRSTSPAIALTADAELNAAEIAYAGYDGMEPRTTSALPTTFTYALTLPKGAKMRAAIYGPGKMIGDPWWTSALATTTTSEFDGGFTTKAAGDAGLDPDAGYSWGTDIQYAAPDGGVSWTAESMVLPIRWQP